MACEITPQISQRDEQLASRIIRSGSNQVTNGAKLYFAIETTVSARHLLLLSREMRLLEDGVGDNAVVFLAAARDPEVTISPEDYISLARQAVEVYRERRKLSCKRRI